MVYLYGWKPSGNNWTATTLSGETPPVAVFNISGNQFSALACIMFVKSGNTYVPYEPY